MNCLILSKNNIKVVLETKHNSVGRDVA